MNDVIRLYMSMVATLAPTTAEHVSGQAVHLGSTVVAEMGCAQGCSQAEAYCYPDHAIVHAQAEGCDRQRLQPGPRLLRCRCKQTGTSWSQGRSPGGCNSVIDGMEVSGCGCDCFACRAWKVASFMGASVSSKLASLTAPLNHPLQALQTCVLPDT